MIQIPFLVAAADPLEHALPHAIHSEPLLRLQVASEGTDIPALFIHDGHYDFYITNHMTMTLLAALMTIGVFWWLAGKLKPRDGGPAVVRGRGRLTQLFETMCVFVRDEVARPNLGHLTDKYIPYLWTIFFFILFANVLGLLPIGYVLELVTGDSHFSHWGGTATSNLSLNVVLAIGSFIAIVGIGIREAGLGHFLGHFNPVGWKHEFPLAIMMVPIGLMLFVLEWMGLLIKCTVLAMRLFGTMMAGHLVITAFVMLIFTAASASTTLGYGVGVAVVIGGTMLTLLELFICMLQAFIFTFLTVLFISSGAVHEHEVEEHGEHDPTSDEAQMDIDKILTPSRLAVPPT
jgi:F-type H+-transporting ATPase subunit a